MVRRLLIGGLLLSLGTACEVEPEPTPLACAAGEPTLELATRDISFGDLEFGADIECGVPPLRGGAVPAFLIRATGIDQAETGMVVELVAYDAETGEDEARIISNGWLCANAGKSAGYWVSSRCTCGTMAGFSKS